MVRGVKELRIRGGGLTLYGFWSRSKHKKCTSAGRRELTWAERARGNVGWRFAICYGAFAVLLVAAHAGQKAGLVEPPVEEATHQAELAESVAEFEESLSKDSRVSVKKDDGEA